MDEGRVGMGGVMREIIGQTGEFRKALEGMGGA